MAVRPQHHRVRVESCHIAAVWANNHSITRQVAGHPGEAAAVQPFAGIFQGFDVDFQVTAVCFADGGHAAVIVFDGDAVVGGAGVQVFRRHGAHDSGGHR